MKNNSNLTIIIGSLWYSCNSRPCMNCAVGTVRRYMCDPWKYHLIVIKKKRSRATSNAHWLMDYCFLTHILEQYIDVILKCRLVGGYGR